MHVCDYLHTHTPMLSLHTYIYVYICIYVYIYMCVCVDYSHVPLTYTDGFSYICIERERGIDICTCRVSRIIQVRRRDKW